MSSNTAPARHRADTKIHSILIDSGRTALPQGGSKVAALALVSGMMVALASPVHASAIAHPSQDAADSALSATASSSDVPVAGAGDVDQSTAYTVRSGDTLGAISAQTGVGLQDLLTLNQLTVTSIIYPGDTVLLSGGSNVMNAEALETRPVASSSPASSEFNFSTQSSSVSPLSNRVSSESGNIWDSAAASEAGTANGRILAFARSQLGAIQDCTVLGEGALRAAGVTGVGDESPESLMAFATPVSDPQPGDFVYYADGGMGFSHNAIYLGNGRAIHSGWNGNQTVEESVDVGSGPVYYRVNG
ncbi:LysM peptidoglycan-binding domain-containing protein [Arthrobacter sp. AET 35A]|nr:LysM peptidoglycan-binding domain-containing protein [Arthrobacter sp. AET 35A]